MNDDFRKDVECKLTVTNSFEFVVGLFYWAGYRGVSADTAETLLLCLQPKNGGFAGAVPSFP